MQAADPYFQDIPWDLIYDENGRLIGEVYMTLPAAPPRNRRSKHKLWEAEADEVGSV